MPSLALIGHLIDGVDGGPTGPVSRGAAARAVGWCEYLQGHARRLYASVTDRVLREINRRGTTILLVEQILEVALVLSHRLYVMDQGRIQFEGTPEALRADPAIQQRFLGV